MSGSGDINLVIPMRGSTTKIKIPKSAAIRNVADLPCDMNELIGSRISVKCIARRYSYDKKNSKFAAAGGAGVAADSIRQGISLVCSSVCQLDF
jgi:hypothetical protein